MRALEFPLQLILNTVANSLRIHWPVALARGHCRLTRLPELLGRSHRARRRSFGSQRDRQQRCRALLQIPRTRPTRQRTCERTSAVPRLCTTVTRQPLFEQAKPKPLSWCVSIRVTSQDGPQTESHIHHRAVRSTLLRTSDLGASSCFPMPRGVLLQTFNS